MRRRRFPLNRVSPHLIPSSTPIPKRSPRSPCPGSPHHPPSTPPPLLLHTLVHPQAYPHPNSLLRSSVSSTPTLPHPSVRYPSGTAHAANRHARCVSARVPLSFTYMSTYLPSRPRSRRLTRVRATPSYNIPRASRTAPLSLSPPCLLSSSSTSLLVLLTPSTQTHAVGGSSGLHSPLTCLL